MAIDPIWYMIGAYALGAIIIAVILAKVFKK
jgi:hypothetical protein